MTGSELGGIIVLFIDGRGSKGGLSEMEGEEDCLGSQDFERFY